MKIQRATTRWFPAEDDPDKAEIQIRHLTEGEFSDIVNNLTEQETIYQQKDSELIPVIKSKTQSGEIQRAIRLKALIGWKNIFDENGKPLEFNDENKIRAFREIDGFGIFVDACRNKLAEDLKQEKKTAEKN